VRVTTESGEAARLKSASIDFKGGTVISREPVAVTLTNGTIEAQGLEISDNGRVLTFTGRVRTVFEGTASDIPPSTSSVAGSSMAQGRVQPARAVAPDIQPMSLRP
jgi:lipopolysaccharide export system protein LptC